MSDTIPVVVTAAGAQPTPPAMLNAALITIAQTLAPGLTANLPGSLIEDMASTATGAAVLLDQARVELINSLTPYGANLWLLTQLGNIYGVQAGQASNPSVYVVFGSTSVGYVIPAGFTVSDGTNQYIVQEGGVIGTSENSTPLFALATTPGPFAIPAGTVTTLITSVPGGVSLFVTNPNGGSPGAPAQTPAQFRTAVLQAGLVAAQGTPNYLKTLLNNVAGVQQNLVSVRQGSGTWEIIVGGSADPIAIGYAIFTSLFDVSTLVGSTLEVTGITNANPGVMTTNLNHGFASGQVINVTGVVGMSGINGTPLTITVLTEKTFSLGINTTSSGAYVSGGVVTPNFRNVTTTINSYPDSYTIPFVVPPSQSVTMTATWNTSSAIFVSATAVAQLVQPAIAAYINAIPVGAPINVLELNSTFITAVQTLLPEALITVLVFTVSINGIVTAPGAGEQIIVGDPESYFICSSAGITVVQG